MRLFCVINRCISNLPPVTSCLDAHTYLLVRLVVAPRPAAATACNARCARSGSCSASMCSTIGETSRQSARSALAASMRRYVTRCCSLYSVSAGSAGAKSAISGAACTQAEVANAMEHQPKYDFTSACGGPSFGFPRRLPGQEGHLWPHLRSYRSSKTTRRCALR